MVNQGPRHDTLARTQWAAFFAAVCAELRQKHGIVLRRTDEGFSAHALYVPACAILARLPEPSALEGSVNRLRLLGQTVNSIVGDMNRHIFGGPSSESVAGNQPPRDAMLLLTLFLPKDRVDDALGDLDERYAKVVNRLGSKRGDIWYWKQVLTSLWPYAKATLRRVSSGAVTKSVALALRLLGQGSIADAVLKAQRSVRNAARK